MQRRRSRPIAPGDAPKPTPPPPVAATMAQPRPPTTAPPFGRLLLAALRSVGIEYITLDHIRKCKKNDLSPREYCEMWKLLHDLVVVVLLDFQVDFDTFRCENSATHEPTQLEIWQELVRFYLYDWGFVCAVFYGTDSVSSGSVVPASVLLMAFAWLLAHSRLIERQQEPILKLYMDTPTVRLPPYASDVSIRSSVVAAVTNEVAVDSQHLHQQLSQTRDFDGSLHQVQSLVGRIHAHRRSLESSQRYYARMLDKLQAKQRERGAQDDELIPAYVAQVLAMGKAHIDLHIRAITERLQMAEDEKVFYKWVNSVVLTYKCPPESVQTAIDSEFQDEIARTHQVFRDSSAVLQQIARLHSDEKKKWGQKPKTRVQQAKMEEKMAKLSHDIAANELWDSSALFIDSTTASTSIVKAPDALDSEESAHPPIDVLMGDLARLQQQLERVMHEITTQYCKAEML